MNNFWYIFHIFGLLLILKINLKSSLQQTHATIYIDHQPRTCSKPVEVLHYTGEQSCNYLSWFTQIILFSIMHGLLSLDKEAKKLRNYLTESVNLLCTLSRCFIQRFKDLCTGNSLKGARGGLAPPGIQNHASPPKLSKRNLINRKTPMDLC